MRWFCLVAVVGCFPLAGCFSPNDGAADEGESLELEPETLPAGNCDTDPNGEDCETEAAPDPSGATSPGDGVDVCQTSEDCSGGFCVADFDPGTLDRGETSCAFACVATLSDTQWCIDDAACCDAGAACTDRGYCVITDDEAGTSTGGSSGGASGSGSTGDTDHESETDTDTDTSGTGT